MGLETAMLGTVAQFGQGVLNPIVQQQHLLCALSGAEPGFA
jgi:hypothetical protein